MCVCDDLPAAIVPALHRLVQRVLQHLASHHDGPLTAHEDGLLAAWRAEAGALLSAVVAVSTVGADASQRPPRSACPQCGRGTAADRWRPRQVQTRLGLLRVRRTVYRCAGCGQRWSRADHTLGLAPAQQTSSGLVAWQARVAALTTFREAAQLLAELSGVAVGTETLRSHAERQGAVLEGQHQDQARQMAAEQAPLPGTAEPAPGALVVQTDGVFVRYRPLAAAAAGAPPTGPSDKSLWREVKLGIIGGWVGARPDAVLQAPSYIAACEAVTDFAPRLATEATRRGALDIVGWEQPPGVDPRLAGVTGPALALLRPVVVLGDGAAWIWETVAPQFAAERIEIVDWFHGAEHLWDLGKALHGEANDQSRVWALSAIQLLWERGATGLLPLLRATAAPPGAATAVLERERGFFARNAARMQ